MSGERRRLIEHFDQNILTFIQADISREVALAKMSADCDACGTKQGGGNFLAALGLLCWTEYVGSFVTGKYGYQQSRRNFEAFFRRLGSGYDHFQTQHDVYDIFRCGMAHEYTVRASSTIAMKRGVENCGVGMDRTGRFYLVVERYGDDFLAAARVLREEILGDAPTMPRRIERPLRRGTRT